MADFINTELNGRYQIRERIGVGGMARVFRAWDMNLDREVAIKILHDHLADDPSFKERFEREAKFIASLNHPNIVQVYDFASIERDGTRAYYMVMPYIKGRSLRDQLEELAATETRMAHPRALEVLLCLCSALGYAHEIGMVHRDVKPANILVDERGQVILTDFGIARLVSAARLTQDGVSTGTPAYMSPEQASGLPGDARSDLYSLGVIAFEVISGRLPYDDQSGVALMVKHLNAPVPRPSTIAPDLPLVIDSFIAQAMAKNPDERFQTAESFADALKQIYLEHFVTTLPPVQTASRSTTTSAYHTVRAGGANGTATGQTGGGTRPTGVQERPGTTTVFTRTPRIFLGGVAALVIVGVLVLLFVRGVGIATAPALPTAAAPDVPAVDSMTSSVLYFTSTFDENDRFRANWTETSVGGFVREITPDGVYRLRNERPATAVTALFNTDYRYGSVSISLTGTLDEETSPAGAFGIVYRFQNEDHYNVFAVDASGRYSIWVRTEGEWRELRGGDEAWTFDAAIRPQGESNRLTVDILGDSMTGYVNGERVVRVTDNTFDDGNIGIYVATSRQGTTTALIDTFLTYPPAPPSMTDG